MKLLICDISLDEAAAAESRRYLRRVTDILCLTSNRVGLMDECHVVTRSSQEMSYKLVYYLQTVVDTCTLSFIYSLGCHWKEVHEFGGCSLAFSANWHILCTKQTIILCNCSFVWELQHQLEWGRFEEHISLSTCFRVDQPFTSRGTLIWFSENFFLC